MSIRPKLGILLFGGLVGLAACSSDRNGSSALFEPKEMIDLGAVVTEDLPERVWGKGYLAFRGFEGRNTFEVHRWEGGSEGRRIYASNSYFKLFNHGGPHVDAPSHISLEGSLDSYPIEAFSGPLRVFDVRQYPLGRSIPEEVFSDSVRPGEVVLIYTGYSPPTTDEGFPETITLSRKAAEYLAGVPIRAFATDAWSVASFQDSTMVDAEVETARAAPIHYSFLSRGIPIFEQLFNVESLLGRDDSEAMYFVGVPLNIQGGDGMMVRPVVFIY
jgi:kynurenine formamidase